MNGRLDHNRVLYKPLTDSNAGDEDELEVISGVGEHSRDVISDVNHEGAQPRTNSVRRQTQKQIGCRTIGLRQLRTILLALASLLLIIFVLKLATYKDLPRNHEIHDNVTHLRADKLVPSPNNSVSSQINATQHQREKIKLLSALVTSKLVRNRPESLIDDHKPKYDDYLSSIIHENDHISFQSMSDLLDDFSYFIGDERLTGARNRGNKWWSIKEVDKKHVIISNYIRAMKSFDPESSVTLITRLTLESQSLYHTLEQCEHWNGPISVSVFLSKGLDIMPVAITLIKFVRQCLPAPLSACMRDKITWHLAFTPKQLDTEALSSSLSYPNYHLDTLHYSSFASSDQCPKLGNLSANELIELFQKDILVRNNMNLISLTETDSNGTADPIMNVIRDVARATAKTKHVLVTNVEEIPTNKTLN